MPNLPEHWAWLGAWLENHWPAVYAAALAGAIAGLRVISGGRSWRRVLLEAPLCGALSLAVSAGLELVGIASSAAPFFGGMVGLLGIEAIRAVALRVFMRQAAQR